MGNFGSRRKKITRQVVKAVSKLEEEWEQAVEDIILPPYDVNFKRHVLLPLDEVYLKPLLLHGPDEKESELRLTVDSDNYVCARSISTYPRLEGGRTGDPICDYFRVQTFPNRQLIVVADGCGWGSGARKAARDAATAFMAYLERHHHQVSDTYHLARLIVRAMAFAQRGLMVGRVTSGYSDEMEPGTTTLLGGVLAKVKASSGDADWQFVWGGVGDCKAYLFSKETHTFRDLTAESRGVQKSYSDCGGRLGDYPSEDGFSKGPDLRNFQINSDECKSGDILFVVSDGIHDNLSPRHLGKQPSDIGLDAADWKDLSSMDRSRGAAQHSEGLLRAILAESKEGKPRASSTTMPEPVLVTSKAKSPVPELDLTPVDVTRKLIAHCLATNFNAATWLRENPQKKLPKDYSLYPGKMDHTTCVAVQVNTIPRLEHDPCDMYEEGAESPLYDAFSDTEASASATSTANGETPSPEEEGEEKNGAVSVALDIPPHEAPPDPPSATSESG